MVKKYARLLEEREINDKTGEVWKLSDCARTWRSGAEKKVIADGFYFAEDGTAYRVENNEE